MATNSFNELTAQELKAKNLDMSHELFNLRLQKATARLEKPHRIRELRKEIARCQTRLSELRNKAAAAKA
jgi:large subunit ribosomal protein L29